MYLPFIKDYFISLRCHFVNDYYSFVIAISFCLFLNVAVFENSFYFIIWCFLK